MFIIMFMFIMVTCLIINNIYIIMNKASNDQTEY